MNRLSLETQTMFGLPPLEHIAMAADLGCACISTGLTPLPWKFERYEAWSLRDNASLRREMKAAMHDRGVAISLVEGFALRPGRDMRDMAGDLDLAADLGAERIGSVSMEPDAARMRDQFGVLADLTAERGLGFMLEFAPPHPINTLQKALAIIDALGQSHVRLTLDAMHFFRTGATLDELRALDPKRIGYAQLCDAPRAPISDNYYDEACFERKVPGEGELPLKDFVAALPRDIVIGLEVPMRTEVEGGAKLREVMERTVAAARALMTAG